MHVIGTLVIGSLMAVFYFYLSSRKTRKIKKLTDVSGAFSRVVKSAVDIMSIVNHLSESTYEETMGLNKAVDLIEYYFKEDETLYYSFDGFQRENAIRFYDMALGSLKTFLSENPHPEVEKLNIIERLENLALEIRFKLTVEEYHGNN